MPPDTSSSYTSGPLQALLQRELGMLAPLLGGIYGVWGLHLRPHKRAPLTLPPHLLSAVLELALDDAGRYAGSLRCEPWQLPFASESFKLIVAQHVLEQVAAPDDAAEELARVLAPEGVALLFGFNPASLWRPWVSRRLRSGLHFASAAGWRQKLERAQLDVLQVRYAGLWSPWSVAETGKSAEVRSLPVLGRFGASWLLIARKRRSTLTPLRLTAARPDLKLNPTLVSGAHRECA
jgi:SAM-dependent methyltransferase